MSMVKEVEGCSVGVAGELPRTAILALSRLLLYKLIHSPNNCRSPRVRSPRSHAWFGLPWWSGPSEPGGGGVRDGQAERVHCGVVRCTGRGGIPARFSGKELRPLSHFKPPFFAKNRHHGGSRAEAADLRQVHPRLRDPRAAAAHSASRRGRGCTAQAPPDSPPPQEPQVVKAHLQTPL